MRLLRLKHCLSLIHDLFLIDILDEPIRIRGDKDNENYLITKIPELNTPAKIIPIFCFLAMGKKFSNETL